MKRNLSAIALGLALAYAATPVMAQTATIDQSGGNSNTGYVEQSNAGSASTATITQIGSENKAGNPGTVGGDGRELSATAGGILQSSSTNVTADVNQTGKNNTGMVKQQSVTTGTATILQNSDYGNSAAITQADSSNVTARVYQNESGNYSNTAVINQTVVSSNALAEVVQGGNGQKAYINQTGVTTGEAKTWQHGSGNTVTVNQGTGSNLYGYVYQSGNTNEATLTQGGSNNYAQYGPGYGIWQAGDRNDSKISQFGTWGNVWTSQIGNDNKATIEQLASATGGDWNSAHITQTNNFNEALIHQEAGSGNNASIAQSGTNVWASDYANKAWIYQVGGNLTASVTQSGGHSNVAGIYQH